MSHLRNIAIGLGAAGLVSGAPLAGCERHTQDCELNPYACPEVGGGGAGAGGSNGGNGGEGGGCTGAACCPADLVCPPCQRCGPSGGCEPVTLPSSGACPDKETCAADLTCRKKNGQSCLFAAQCASGSCDDDGGVCQACAADTDCEGATPHCNGGLCKQPDGAACVTDLHCRTNRCLEGVCALCASDSECASGKCDEAASACLLSGGQPCKEDAECASGKCTGAHACTGS